MSDQIEVNAKNMSDLARKDNQELAETLSKIEKAAKEGKVSLDISGVIQSTTKTELESRGFKVEIGGRYNERDTYITW